jgi:hypothetical protein
MYESTTYPNSTIKGFDLGIDLLESGSTWNNIFSTEFNCYRGIYFGSQTKGRISFCDFNNMPAGMALDPIPNADEEDLNMNGTWDDGSYGIYMIGGVNNTISSNNLSIQQETTNRYGIICINNPKQNNIHLNTFNNQKRALTCWKQNKLQDNSQDGVQITCNDFITTGNAFGYDIRVQDIGTTPNAGIAWKQDAYGTSQLSASNQFDPNGASICDDLRDMTLVGHEYHYSDNEGFVEWCNPVTPNYELPTDNLCPTLALPSFSNSNPVINLNNTLAALEIAFGQKYQQWIDLIDGGDTEATKEEILMADFNEALSLYNELMAKSPALSEVAMIALIKKEYDFPASLLTALLQANPSAAKSAEIQAELDARINELTEYQRALVNVGLDLTSLKEMLEADMVTLNFERHEACRIALDELLLLENNTNRDAQMQEIMQKEFDLVDRYKRIDRYICIGEISAAQNLIDNIPTDFDLSERQQQEQLEMMSLYTLEIELISSEVISSDNMQYLEEKMTSRHDLVATKAWSLLQGYGKYNTDDPLYDEEGLSTRSLIRISDVSFENLASLYPNPASSFCLVKLSEPLDLHYVIICNAFGQQVVQIPVKKEMLEIVADTKGLPPGNYFVQLWNNQSELIMTLPLIVE